MDKEAIGNVTYSIDVAEEIIKETMVRVEDCELNEIDYSTMRTTLLKVMEILDIARKVMENAEED